MKILQINNYHHIKGGSDTVYLNTGKLLENMGHEVIYFSTIENQNAKKGVNHYFVQTEKLYEGNFLDKIKKIPSFIYSSSSYKSLKKMLEVEKPDIAHLHIFYGRLTSSILKALKEKSIPTVMTVHEYRMLCPVSVFVNHKGEICEKCAGKGSNLNCVTSRCNKGSYANSAISALEATFRDKFFDYKKFIDHFIMVSNFIKNKHSEYSPGIEEKSTVLHNFQKIDYNDSGSKKEVDLVYFGRLSREKGIMTLVKAVKDKKEVSLKIIGTGPQEDSIRRMIESHSLHNVELIGFSRGNDLWRHITSAKFVVVPSECYENNPMTVIESLFLGVPVIGANIGGIPEIVKSDHGFIFESGNTEDLKEKIELVKNINTNEYKKMEQNAKIFANEVFSEESHYLQLMEIYKKVLREKKEMA